MRYIAIEEFCQHHGVEVRLVREFVDFGLVQVQQQDEQEVLRRKDIKRLERMLRLARDLNINLEGIDIILNMRSKLKRLHRENQLLQTRLNHLEQEKNLRLVETPLANGFIIDL